MGIENIIESIAVTQVIAIAGRGNEAERPKRGIDGAAAADDFRTVVPVERLAANHEAFVGLGAGPVERPSAVFIGQHIANLITVTPTRIELSFRGTRLFGFRS